MSTEAIQKGYPFGQKMVCKGLDLGAELSRIINFVEGRNIRKVIGGRGIFEPQEFFFVIKFLV